MANFQIWRGEEGDSRPGEMVATSTIDTTAPKAEVKAAIAALKAQAETFRLDGYYVIARNAETGRIAVTMGHVPANVEFDRETQWVAVRVVPTAVGGDPPRGVWLDTDSVQVRVSVDGSNVDLRFKHRGAP